MMKKYQLSKIKKKCKHENAELISTYTDDYEGRTYGIIRCPECGKQWEERIYMGKCDYPKSKDFKERL